MYHLSLYSWNQGVVFKISDRRNDDFWIQIFLVGFPSVRYLPALSLEFKFWAQSENETEFSIEVFYITLFLYSDTQTKKIILMSVINNCYKCLCVFIVIWMWNLANFLHITWYVHILQDAYTKLHKTIWVHFHFLLEIAEGEFLTALCFS